MRYALSAERGMIQGPKRGSSPGKLRQMYLLAFIVASSISA